jgi:hypothetical protein
MSEFEKTMAGLLGYESADDTEDTNLNDGTGDDGTGDSGSGDDGTGTGDDGSGDAGAGDGDGDSGAGGDGDAGSGDGDAGDGDDGAGDAGAGDGAGDTKIIPDQKDTKKDTGVDFETSLAEKSGGKFKTYADIEAAIADAGENAYASDMVRKLNDYVKGGGRTEDFLRTQTVNYKELNHVDAIRELKTLKNKSLSQEEIEFLITEDYGVGENATEREKKLANIRIKEDGEAARIELVAHQEKWAAAPEATADQKIAATKQETEAWKTELSEAVDKNAEITFKVGEEDFKFKPSDDAKVNVKEAHDLNKFWDRYKTDTGYDVNKFVREMYILNNIEEITKSIATFAKGQGLEDVVDDIKNVDLEGKDNKRSDGNKPSILKQIGDEIFL